MRLQATPAEVCQLRDYIERVSGIVVPMTSDYLIDSRLGGLVAEQGCSSFGEFYVKLENSADGSLRDQVVDLMTTNETLWFRDTHPFTTLENQVLPRLAEEFEAGRRRSIRIWSAACSTGQEPYSIAMLVLDAVEAVSCFSRDAVQIVATGICRDALKRASEGKYRPIEMRRGLPDRYRHRYFEDAGRYWKLSPDVKRQVSFKRFNLQDSFAELGSFDVIFCRNVAIYFSDAFRGELFDRFADSLNPRGYFFLGTAESVGAYSDRFELVKTDPGFCFRRL